MTSAGGWGVASYGEGARMVTLARAVPALVRILFLPKL